MASIHGVAGEWARVKGTVLGLWPLFAGVFAAGCSAARAYSPGELVMINIAIMTAADAEAMHLFIVLVRLL